MERMILGIALLLSTGFCWLGGYYFGSSQQSEIMKCEQAFPTDDQPREPVVQQLVQDQWVDITPVISVRCNNPDGCKIPDLMCGSATE